MCGIFGYRFIPGHEEEHRERLLHMASVLRHRGPDQEGGVIDPKHDLALGACRLAIIDVRGGSQPVSNETGDIWAVVNGEIFDYLEHRKILSQAGHRFRSACDSEVIVHAYEEYGPDFVERIDGQFVIVIWDRREGVLWLYRDRFGICPLHYARTPDGGFIFGSEAKAIFSLKIMEPKVDGRALDQAFSYWTNAPGHTCFEGVREIRPAHRLRLDRNGILHEERYWSLPESAAAQRQSRSLDPDDIEQQIREEVTTAVQSRLVADVPVGVYLSGGIDSSIITLLARETVGPDLQTFSVEFEDPVFDESEFQEIVRHALALKNHCALRITARDIGVHFPTAVYHAERILFRSAPVPLLLLSKEVRNRGIKVILSGEGADEVFWGYPLFKEAMIRRYWRRNPTSKVRPRLLERIFPFMPQYSGRYVQLLIESYRRTLDYSGPLDTHVTRFASCAHQKKYYAPAFRASLHGYDPITHLQEALGNDLEQVNYLQRAQIIEQETLLSGYLLSSQGDRMSMAHSVEARIPYLKHSLVTAAIALPDHNKLLGLKDKRILRKAFGDSLPSSIAGRIKHPYQAPDVKAFFYDNGQEADYVDELLHRKRLEDTGFFDPAVVAQFLKKVRTTPAERFSTQDNMTIVLLLSTQLLALHFSRQIERNLVLHPSTFHVSLLSP